MGKEVEGFRRFNRLFFGCKGSPYNAVQGMCRALEIVKGDRSDRNNPFHWATILLNLPSARDYDPTLPRVVKTTADGKPAGDAVMYMDDGRPVGESEEGCRQVGRALSSRLNHLGQQDAARKRRPPSRAPGA